MKEKLLYLALYGAATVAALAKLLVVAANLRPDSLGRYTLILVAAALLTYLSTLGVFEAYLVRLNRGSGTTQSRAIDRDSGMLFSSAIACALAALLAVPATVFFQLPGSLSFAGACILVLHVLSGGLLAQVQALQRPLEYAFCLLAKSLVPIALMLSGTPGDDLALILWCEVAGIGGISAFLLARTGLPRLRNWRTEHVRSLIRDGGPYTANAAVHNLASNADKWAVGAALGAGALGAYSFSAQVVTMALAFSAMIQTYAFPRFVSAFTLEGGLARLRARVIRLGLASAAIFAGLVIGIVMFASWGVPRWYPDYAGALGLLPMFALAATFIAANHFEVVFRLTGNGPRYLAIQSGVLAVAIVLYAWGARADWSLPAFVGIFAASRGAQLLLSCVSAMRLAPARPAASAP